VNPSGVAAWRLAMKVRAKNEQASRDRTAEFRALLRQARDQLLRTVATTPLAAQEPRGFIEGSGRLVAEDLLSRG
jgi:predicted aminopeptidase